ncbi:MAG TPA: hypothetical protein VMW69_08935 [Spirochaetia bacterium]|nr:hypothetical protein [Spirochaetia bacterium]
MSYKLSEGAEANRLWIQYSRGLLTFIPAYIIYLLISGVVPLTFSYGGIYFYYFFHNAVYFPLIGVLAYMLFKRFSADPDRGSVSEGFVFLAGFFTFASVLEIVRHFPNYDAYSLFLYPTMRLATISALAIVVARYFDEVGWQRWVYLAVGLVFVAATAVVPFLFVVHLGIAALIVAIVLFAASVFPYAVMSL